MNRLNAIQTVLWLIPVVSGLTMGLGDRIYQSFYPEFSELDFVSIFFSLFMIMCVVGACPIAYKWFEK